MLTRVVKGFYHLIFSMFKLILRLSYKSSLDSAKRDRQSSSERARTQLVCLLKIESSDVILARIFQGAKLLKCQLNAFLKR